MLKKKVEDSSCHSCLVWRRRRRENGDEITKLTERSSLLPIIYNFISCLRTAAAPVIHSIVGVPFSQPPISGEHLHDMTSTLFRLEAELSPIEWSAWANILTPRQLTSPTSIHNLPFTLYTSHPLITSGGSPIYSSSSQPTDREKHQGL